MTAAKQAKAAGLPSLGKVCELSGVPRSTLDHWSKHKPQLFDIVLQGCRVKEWEKQWKQ